VIGLEQAVHLLAKSSPKQSAQYGLSSRDVNRCPARELLQLLQVKQSLCHGSFLYVTPPLVIICNKDFAISHNTSRYISLRRFLFAFIEHFIELISQDFSSKHDMKKIKGTESNSKNADT